MGNWVKRILAVVLVCILVDGVGVAGRLPVRASGIPSGYTPIYTAQDLSNMRNNLSGNYILMNNIDLSGSNWTPINGWFRGTLDGQGFVIQNLTITGNPTTPVGLFSTVNGATIMNVGLVGTNINISNSTEIYAGSISGISESSIYTNCFNTGSITVSGASYSYAGGLYAFSRRTANTINNCYNTGNMSATSSAGMAYAGGVCGDNMSTSGAIVISYNTGNISAKGSSWTGAGGICAITTGTISNSYNIGRISAANTAANAGADAGGICGNTTNSINNCYSIGAVSANSPNSAVIGGLCGTNTGSTNNSYCFDLYGSTHGAQLTGNQMRQQSSFVGFDFTNTWLMPVGGSPQLKAFAKGDLSPQQAANALLDSIQIGYAAGDSVDSVTKNLTLPTANPYGLEVKWNTSNYAISNAGVVTRPAQDMQVTITVSVVFERLSSSYRSYTKTFTVILKGTGEVQPPQINIDYAQFTPLTHADAVELLRFLGNTGPLADVTKLAPDYYNMLTGKLRNQPDYEHTVKIAFIAFAYASIDAQLTVAGLRMNIAETALVQWLGTNGENKMVQQFVNEAVGVVKGAAKKGVWAANGIELASLPNGQSIVNDFIDWTWTMTNSIGGLFAIKDRDDMLYLSTYLNNRGSEWLELALDAQALYSTFGINRSKLDRFAEAIYQVDQSIKNTVVKVVTAKCPVTMDIFNQNNTLVASLGNEEAGSMFNEYGSFYVIPESGTSDFIKVAKLNSKDYYVVIRGQGEGNMDFSVETPGDEGAISYSTTVPVSSIMEATAYLNEEEPLLAISGISENDEPDIAFLLEGQPALQRKLTLAHTEGGFVLGAQRIVNGAEVIASAYPDDGYKFLGWYENGMKIQDAEAIYSFTIGSDRMLEARFAEQEYTYDITVINDGNGTGSASPANAATGTEITLTATPNSGYRFKEWQVVSGGATIAANKFTMPAGAVEVKAIFELIPSNTYSLNATAGMNGSVSGMASGNYAAGTAINITATANSGYHFTSWSIDGATITGGNTANPATFTMPAGAVTLTANFEQNAPSTYTVTVSGGTGSGNYAQGQTVTINASTPPAGGFLTGKRFKEWTSSPSAVFNNKNSASTTFNMPSQNVTVTAVYEDVIRLWGKNTNYVSNIWNWLLCILLFGWIWMAF